MSSCWYGLRGPVVRQSGTNGTVTLPAGSKLLRVRTYAVSAGSVRIFDDAASITLPANSGWFVLDYEHTNVVAPTSAPTIVFASTASYLVEYSTEGT